MFLTITMLSIPNPSNQFKSIFPSLMVIILISIVVLCSVLWAHLVHDISLKELTGDFAATLEVPIYVGIQSQIGIFFWAASAAICLYTTTLISGSEQKKFLILFGVLTLLLGLDDIFLLHEVVFPSIGIHQKIVQLGYMAFIGALVLRFYKTIFRSDYLLLLTGLFFFGISVMIDNFLSNESVIISQYIEDGAKFIGILCWSVYLYRTSYQMVVLKVDY